MQTDLLLRLAVTRMLESKTGKHGRIAEHFVEGAENHRPGPPHSVSRRKGENDDVAGLRTHGRNEYPTRIFELFSIISKLTYLKTFNGEMEAIPKITELHECREDQTTTGY